jgi:hypothetical protein
LAMAASFVLAVGVTGITGVIGITGITGVIGATTAAGIGPVTPGMARTEDIRQDIRQWRLPSLARLPRLRPARAPV